MTQQWQLSGNAESVDWSDLAMAGRAYADNLVGEPAVSKVMHMMADEIERLRAVIRPESHAESDENRVLYDTKGPRNGALSGCETVPDPDSRVWETQRTPQPQMAAWQLVHECERLRDELASATRHMEMAEAAWLRETAGNSPVAIKITDAEREALDTAEASLMRESTDLHTPLFVRQRLGAAAATLRGLLERLE